MKSQLKKVMGEGEEIQCCGGKLVSKRLNTKLQFSSSFMNIFLLQ